MTEDGKSTAHTRWAVLLVSQTDDLAYGLRSNQYRRVIPVSSGSRQQLLDFVETDVVGPQRISCATNFYYPVHDKTVTETLPFCTHGNFHPQSVKTETGITSSVHYRSWWHSPRGTTGIHTTACIVELGMYRIQGL